MGFGRILNGPAAYGEAGAGGRGGAVARYFVNPGSQSEIAGM
jgi:hypothetical protein